MIKPTIHLNGTSPATLREDYLKARRAVEEAKYVLTTIEFNPRDYYPQGDTAWAEARAEMTDRLECLDRVSRELLDIAVHCQEALDAKEKRIYEQTRKQKSES